MDRDRESDSSDAALAGLVRATARVADVVEGLHGRERVDVAGLPAGALAHVLALAATPAHPVVVVTPDLDSARRTAQNLRFFLGGGEGAEGGEDSVDDVLLFPAADTSAFLDVAPDRRAAMDRLACLVHLSLGLPWRALVIPASGLLRKVPPRNALAERSKLVRPETELDRDEFLRILTECGYLRVPVAEDPGTFAVRGGIVDVYPPHAKHPVRIELDDWLITSIKAFDPEDQRTIGAVTSVLVHPVREAIAGPAETALARERVRALCDRIDLPSIKTRQLLEDLENGRLVYGVEALLPAFYRGLETVTDYLPSHSRIALLDPTAIHAAAEEERERASSDRGAKFAEGQPVFEVDDLYLHPSELRERLDAHRVSVFHRIAFASGAEEGDTSLAVFESTRGREVLLLGAEDHAPLVAELRASRAGAARDEALRPVADRAGSYLDHGMRLFFAARTHTQAERLISLLRGYEVPVRSKARPFGRELLAEERSGKAEVVVGALGDGFAMPTEGLVFITEEEIFGTRAHKRPSKSRKKIRGGAFLEDLRELSVGDFVVHADHGVGRYLGLERKVIGQSAAERFRGDAAQAIEVLVVEYAGGDRLFLPVTRLSQIQKYAGQEGRAPKVDRLGGSTFAKTKKNVERAVKQLAEELLKLYAERASAKREPLPPADRSYAEFEATFPFDETPDQARAIEDVLYDLEQGQPMDRLVCGDVGFGKTEVAIRAAFRVAMSGRQVAVLCPTTVLAQQHYLNFRARYAEHPIEVRSLSRFVDKEEEVKVVQGLKDGRVDVVIGTHRLLSKDVHFKNLGLLVVDEEQRFGVTHKERIKKMRTQVDVLTLSATPIPRTLQLAIGGLRDLSLITTAPADRRAVRTYACRWDDHTLKEAIERELRRGGQVFFVYNRIEGLYERAQRLQDLLPTARIAVAHGQMKEGALEQTMTDFVDGQYDVLCSTAIIESGIDIPRANTMIIDRADTFGLAQLYQLRGRVGRSRERAYCYLVTPPPSQLTDEARARIEALERFTELGSGYRVASLDMELRGAGDLLGADQSGSAALVGFDLFVRMLEEAVAELQGEEVVHEVDPELTLDVEHFLPDDFIDDVGLRLSFYKRLATAEDDEAIDQLAGELEDRFGPPPPPAAQLVRAMRLKPRLRDLRILGCEATRARVTLHLREDTPLDPSKILALVGQPGSPWKLTPDMKLTRRFDELREGDAIDRASELLDALRKLVKDPD
ncbi:MAG: transcription-repair coupling factor [Polyangiales bacterium]